MARVITVGELITKLNEYHWDLPVTVNRDNGVTISEVSGDYGQSGRLKDIEGVNLITGEITE